MRNQARYAAPKYRQIHNKAAAPKPAANNATGRPVTIAAPSSLVTLLASAVALLIRLPAALVALPIALVASLTTLPAFVATLVATLSTLLAALVAADAAPEVMVLKVPSALVTTEAAPVATSVATDAAPEAISVATEATPEGRSPPMAEVTSEMTESTWARERVERARRVVAVKVFIFGGWVLENEWSRFEEAE
jgi:hypothetical protein